MFPFISLILLGTSFTLASGLELVAVGGNNAFCSGASVTLQCTLTGDVLSWHIGDRAINFVRGFSSEADAGLYHGQLLELNSTHLRSNLTFTFTSQITISCSDGSVNTSIKLSIEGPPSAPDRPLTALDRIEGVNKTFSSVTVVWNIPDTNNAHISSYEVTVVPSISLPASGVIAADNPLFQTRQLTLTLQHDRQYYTTVRAKSCHDTVEGEVSSPLSINVQVPPQVVVCTALPVYDESNTFERIEIQWEPIADCGDYITDGITASVQNYTINVAPDINVIIEASNSAVCSTTSCKYDYQVTSEDSYFNSTVYVSAKNLLTDGHSETQICNNTEIKEVITFTASCYRRDLLPEEGNIIYLNSLCLELPHGMVCHCGLTPGAVAVYMCNEGYTLTGEDSRRVCEASGKWSGVYTQQCVPTLPTTTDTTNIHQTTGPTCTTGSDQTPIIAASISAGTILCIVSCLIGALLHRTLVNLFCKTCHRKPQPKTGHLYDEITLNLPATIQESDSAHEEKIATVGNTAYSTVKPT